MNRTAALVAAFVGLLVMPAAASAGHGLNLSALADHPVPGISPQSPPPPGFTSGGPGARWEQIATFPTGNPHTDVDFFSQKGNTFVSVGTLGTGPNAGGQEIFQLTEGDRVAPKAVKTYPSASCISNPSAALGLQHDVEAAPKGGAILNADVLAADRRDTQLLIDATDAPGRCHDQGAFGVSQVPQGGLELIDVTNPGAPNAIGLTSHIGQSHTVNVDPRRPHIAYSVTSDSVTVNAEGRRTNEINDGQLALDGFEVVDMSSCMNFPAGTALDQKRAACRPQVYRYRYPSTDQSLGHTNKSSVYGCHELEVYPDDRLTCGSGAAMIALDMKGAFDDRGTPNNFADDKPRGTPLPCRVRDSSSAPPFGTGAKITDCRDGQGEGTNDLAVKEWIAAGQPSLEGVRWIGSAFHAGRESSTGAASPKFDSTQDIDFNHEAELTNSGKFVLSTDERGGGVVPPGASCSPANDLKQGNGGVHAYRVDKLLTRRPADATDAAGSYARTSKGDKAIYRARIRTKAQASLCTAHVFQQIPGQNRVFMGWYSQGTQVVDFTENENGTLDFKEAGYFIPTNANEWTSHVFKVDRNADGTFTYYGVASDFALGDGGRSTVDVYKVTLPPPPAPRGQLAGVGKGFAPSSCLARRVRIGNRNIGRLKLRQTRARTARRARPLGARITRKQRVLRYCVKGPNRKVRGVAVFDRKRKTRVVMSNATGHKRKRIGAGSSRKALRRKFGKRLRRIGPGLRIVRGSRKARNRVVFKITKTRVRYVALTDRKLAKRPRTLRAYLRRAKLR